MTPKEQVIRRLERSLDAITLSEIREDVNFLIAHQETVEGTPLERQPQKLHMADSLREMADFVLSRLPADATLREFIDELEEMEAVEEGYRAMDEGNVMSFEEFLESTRPCLSKSS